MIDIGPNLFKLLDDVLFALVMITLLVGLFKIGQK